MNKKDNLLPAVTFILVISVILIIIFIHLFGDRLRIIPMHHTSPVSSAKETHSFHFKSTDILHDNTISESAPSPYYYRGYNNSKHHSHIQQRIHGQKLTSDEIEKRNYFRRIYDLLHTRITKSSI